MSNIGLSISGLSHHYGEKVALDKVSFDAAQGEFCALLGPNGAGKSTLFSLLCRLFVPGSGQIAIAGHNLAVQPGKALAQLGIVFQQPTLDLDLSVNQNLNYFAGLHGMSPKAAAGSIASALERLDMLDRIDEKVRTLNGGHRRRMEIARALVHQPKVLILDEPTVGLDASTRRLITDHVHDLAKVDGITVLWATHLVDEVRPDDRVVILHDGKIVRDGLTRKITGRGNLQDVFVALTEGEHP